MYLRLDSWYGIYVLEEYIKDKFCNFFSAIIIGEKLLFESYKLIEIQHGIIVIIYIC